MHHLNSEIFEEFNGVPGTYIKSFLISDIVNLNKWQSTHEANLSNLDTFLGRPGIHYINPDVAKRDPNQQGFKFKDEEEKMK